MSHSLHGTSVLVVEDEIIIGMMICNEVALARGVAIGPVTSVAAALEKIESQLVDAVILDAKLADGSAEELATCLTDRRIPYLVTSGYERENLPGPLRSAPFAAKPISVPLLVEALETLMTSVGRCSDHPRHSRAPVPDSRPTTRPTSRGDRKQLLQLAVNLDAYEQP
jgi:CheY-like chemotaxis protein